MARVDRTPLSTPVFAVLLIIFIVLTGYFGYDAYKINENANYLKGVCITKSVATITNSYKVGKFYRSPYMEAEFGSEGGKFQAIGKADNGIRAGSTIEVHFNPYSPQENYCGTAPNGVGVVEVLCVAVPFICCIACLIGMFNNKKHKVDYTSAYHYYKSTNR